MSIPQLANWKKIVKTLWPLLFSIIIVAIAFFPVVFQNKTMLFSTLAGGVMGTAPPWGAEPEEDVAAKAVHFFDGGASAWQDEPMTEKISYLYKEGAIPLWTSSMGLGKPLAAEMVSAVFFPLKAIVYLFPTPVGWDIFLLFRILFSIVTTYIFLRLLKLEKISSLIGGIMYGLNGYFIVYIPMVHLNAEILLPLLFISIELIILKKTYSWILLAATIFGLATSGHPESAVLIFTFGFFYFLFRIWKDVEYKKITGYLILGITTGLLLSSFLIFPFLELYQLAFSNHLPNGGFSLVHYPFSRFLTDFLYPHIYSGQWVGIFGGFFVLLGILAVKKQNKIALFFLLSFILCVTKQYGLLNYNWLNSVPIYNLFYFGKYIVPIFIFSTAMLGAFGFQFLLVQKRIHTLLLLFPLVLVLITPTMQSSIPFLSVPIDASNLKYIWIWLLALLGIIGLILLEYKKEQFHYVPKIMGLILIIEMIALVPNEWPARYDAYTTPPYIKFLQERKPDRIFGLDSLLYPDSASAFQLSDIRDLDAVYVDHYFKYIRAFINPSIVDRFTGTAETASKENLPTQFQNNPFFDLLNVKYVISKKPIIGSHIFIDDIIDDKQQIDPPIQLSSFVINGEPKPVLFQHPGAGTQSVVKKIITPNEQTTLSFDAAIDPAAWNQVGDGVQFSVTIEGDPNPLFTQWIDPKNNPNDRKWFHSDLPLRQYAGKEITLLLITEMGSDNSWDFAGWGNLTITDVIEDTNPQYVSVYADEVGISKNTHAYPRAFLVSNTISASSDEDAIVKMKATDFDPRTTAVVTSNEQPPELQTKESIPFKSTKVVEYTDHSVTIKTDAPRDSLLVLSDTYYPGWVVTVDGKKEKIYQTDLALRGVFINEGKHTIVFKYRPKTFIIGLLLSAVTLVSIILWVTKKELLLRRNKQ